MPRVAFNVYLSPGNEEIDRYRPSCVVELEDLLWTADIQVQLPFSGV